MSYTEKFGMFRGKYYARIIGKLLNLPLYILMIPLLFIWLLCEHSTIRNSFVSFIGYYSFRLVEKLDFLSRNIIMQDICGWYD